MRIRHLIYMSINYVFCAEKRFEQTSGSPSNMTLAYVKFVFGICGLNY